MPSRIYIGNTFVKFYMAEGGFGGRDVGRTRQATLGIVRTTVVLG